MAPFLIAVIGGLTNDQSMLINRMPDTGETLRSNSYHQTLGGKGANAAISAYRSCHIKPEVEQEAREEPIQASLTTDIPLDDIHVRFIGRVGDLPNLEFFRKVFHSSGVETSGLKISEGYPTATTFVIIEQWTGRTINIVHSGANMSFVEEEFLTAHDLGSGMRPDLVLTHTGITIDAVEQVIETAGKNKIEVLVQAAPAHPLSRSVYKYITHILFNEAAAGIMSGRSVHEVNEESWAEIAQEFLNKGVMNVVLTAGDKGTFYARKTESGLIESGHVPAFKVTVVDTTGGDSAFTGAYASEYVMQKAKREWDISLAVKRASKAFALTVGRIGAQTGIPWANEISSLDGELNHSLSSGEQAVDLPIRQTPTEAPNEAPKEVNKLDVAVNETQIQETRTFTTV